MRILAWWRRNDAFRHIEKKQVPEDANALGACRENLEVLRHLLTAEDDYARLMKTEVLRELGEFEPALQALDLVESPELDPVVQQFRLLCDDRDTCVRELHFPDN